ncbi:MAG: sugar ABC transporter ATP-binding protein [Chloroflexia bacterium]|nr:sugar ABC transporter ATP-binding protein [Chloroflexia bacterium]
MHVSIQQLNKSFGPVSANQNITIAFAAGQIHGILGENGAGKSTLMKLLSGVYKPDSGQIFINGNAVTLGTPRLAVQIGIGMVGQDPLDVPVFSVLENIACGMQMPNDADIRQIHWSTTLGFPLSPDQRMRDLTVGQRQQVEIVRLLIAGSHVLILDEPTTGITAAQVEALFTALKTIVTTGKTVLFVTHKLDEIAVLCDTVTVLRAGQIVGTQMAMPISKETMLTAMFGEFLNHPNAGAKSIPTDAPRWQLKDTMLHDATFVLGPFNLSLPKGMIIGLAGLEGSGQRIFMQHLAGTFYPDRGQVHFNGQPLTRANPLVAWLPADRLHEGIIGAMSLSEHVLLMRDSLLAANQNATEKAAQLIADYAIKATPDMPLQQLSGGNQQRAMLALIPESAQGILLEHPTRGLDTVSAMAIWQRLQVRRDNGATVLFFSADLSEVMQYSDAVLVFFGGQVSRLLARDTLSEEVLAALIGGVGFAEVSA